MVLHGQVQAGVWQLGMQVSLKQMPEISNEGHNTSSAGSCSKSVPQSGRVQAGARQVCVKVSLKRWTVGACQQVYASPGTFPISLSTAVSRVYIS